MRTNGYAATIFQAKNARRVVAKGICLLIVRIQHRTIPNRDTSGILPVIHYLNPSNYPDSFSKRDVILPNCPPIPVDQETKKGLHLAVCPLNRILQSRLFLHIVLSCSNHTKSCNTLVRFLAVPAQSRLALQSAQASQFHESRSPAVFSACLTQSCAYPFESSQGQSSPAFAVRKCPCSRPASKCLQCNFNPVIHIDSFVVILMRIPITRCDNNSIAMIRKILSPPTKRTI